MAGKKLHLEDRLCLFKEGCFYEQGRKFNELTQIRDWGFWLGEVPVTASHNAGRAQGQKQK